MEVTQAIHTIKVKGSWPQVQSKCVQLLNQQGAAIAEGVVKEETLKRVRERVCPTLEKIAKVLEESGQHLSEYVKEEFGLVRAPPVGNGKTNIHFDPYESDQHEALEMLATDGHFSEIAKAYLGESCELSEAGASITIPGGEGMEWHRDGTEGEVTVLVALDDISEEQGFVGVLPGSHSNATLNKETEECIDKESAMWYAYRAGQPLVIDARTQHCVCKNTSEKTRCILWYIYNSED